MKVKVKMKARVPLFCLNMDIVYTNTINHIDTCAVDRVYNSPRWRQDPVQVLAGGMPAVEEIRKFTMMAAFTAIMFMMTMMMILITCHTSSLGAYKMKAS